MGKTFVSEKSALMGLIFHKALAKADYFISSTQHARQRSRPQNGRRLIL